MRRQRGKTPACPCDTCTNYVIFQCSSTTRPSRQRGWMEATAVMRTSTPIMHASQLLNRVCAFICTLLFVCVFLAHCTMSWTMSTLLLASACIHMSLGTSVCARVFLNEHPFACMFHTSACMYSYVPGHILITSVCTCVPQCVRHFCVSVRSTSYRRLSLPRINLDTLVRKYTRESENESERDQAQLSLSPPPEPLSLVARSETPEPLGGVCLRQSVSCCGARDTRQ